MTKCDRMDNMGETGQRIYYPGSKLLLAIETEKNTINIMDN